MRDVTVSKRASLSDLAALIGVPIEQLSLAVLNAVIADPLYLHHLAVCKHDREFLEVLFEEAERRFATDYPGEPSWRLVFRATSAVTRWANSGFARSSAQEYERRVSICGSCEHLRKVGQDSLVYRLLTANQRSMGTCGLCGCSVAMKARLLSESCPDTSAGKLGRWAAL